MSALQAQLEAMELRHEQQENSLARMHLVKEANDMAKCTQTQYEDLIAKKNEEIRGFRHELGALLKEFQLLSAK